MSTDNPSGNSGGAGGEPQESKTVSYDSFSKVLGEKKKIQQSFEETKARLDLYEQEKMEADGKLKELNEKLKKSLDESKAEKTKLAKTVQDKVIFAQFAREAEKLGCQDVKLAYQACDLGDIEVTEDLELDQAKLQEKLSNLTKDKHFLFKKDVKAPNDLTPGGKISSKSLSELSDEELKKLL